MNEFPISGFSQNLLRWYGRNGRSLPWRISPREVKRGVKPDPYHIWLSEVMLQQTTVSTAIPYFEKFLRNWPTLADLARASQEDILKQWAGLGYYSRARNLKKCTDILAQRYGGQFPKTARELILLPGIGPYISGAISAIAFSESSAPVDGNIKRVASRHLALANPPAELTEKCRLFMQAHMSSISARSRGNFVQAMMDLGATVCVPRNPACGRCPVKRTCKAARTDSVESYPPKPKRKAKPIRLGAAFVSVRKDGAIWLVKRPETGLLGSMSSVPTSDWSAVTDGETGAKSAPIKARWRFCGTVTHTFTHFHLKLEVYSAKISKNPEIRGWWSSPEEIGKEALPRVFKKAIEEAGR